MRKTTYRRIGSLKKGLEILDAIARDPAPAEEIADAVGLPKSSVMCYLKTMEDAGVVQFDGRWRVGMKLAVFWATVKSQKEAEIIRNQEELRRII